MDFNYISLVCIVKKDSFVKNITIIQIIQVCHRREEAMLCNFENI